MLCCVKSSEDSSSSVCKSSHAFEEEQLLSQVSRDPSEICDQDYVLTNVSNDVFMIIFKQILLKHNGLAKLGHLQLTSKRARALIESAIYTYVKTLVIMRGVAKVSSQKETSHELLKWNFSFLLNRCKFKTGFYVVGVYGEDDQPIILNESYIKCLKFLIARVNLITKIRLRDVFDKRMNSEFQKIVQILESQKVVLKQLNIRGCYDWCDLLSEFIARNSATLKTIRMDHPFKAISAKKSINLSLKKLTIWMGNVGEAEVVDFNTRFKSLIGGRWRVKKLKVFDKATATEIAPVFIDLIQILAPESLKWDYVQTGRIRSGKIFYGDLTEDERWLQFVLAKKEKLSSIRSLSIEQASLKNWGQSPLEFSQMKSCFPSLQKFRMTCLFQTQPAHDIAMILSFTADLFAHWPDLDATVYFTSAKLGMDSNVPILKEFSEQEKASVFNLPEMMITLPNVARVSICPLVHQHKQPIVKVESTGKAKVFCKFAVQKPVNCHTDVQYPIGCCDGLATRYISSNGWASVLAPLPADQRCILPDKNLMD